MTGSTVPLSIRGMKSPSFHFANQTEAGAPQAEMPALQALGIGADSPPSGNTGGKMTKPNYTYTDPETGEISLMCPIAGMQGLYEVIPISSDGLHPYAAITDYLNCTFLFDPQRQSLAVLFQELFDVLGRRFGPAVKRKKGFIGYEESYDLGHSAAIFGIGGESQNGRAIVSMSGVSCSLVKDWQRVVDYFQDCRDARITRWDGAVDDYSGVHSVDWAEGQYLAGNFTAGGNKPKCKNYGNWTDPDGTGRSFEVGKRKNGKRIQIYEKGQQLGALWHPWVRWEVELHNKDRVIPWDVLLKPAHYVVGSYPKVLGWVQEEMTRVRTLRAEMEISYDHLAACASNTYGSLLNVMLEVEGSAEAVIKKLKRVGIPRRLQHPLIDCREGLTA